MYLDSKLLLLWAGNKTNCTVYVPLEKVKNPIIDRLVEAGVRIQTIIGLDGAQVANNKCGFPIAPIPVSY